MLCANSPNLEKTDIFVFIFWYAVIDDYLNWTKKLQNCCVFNLFMSFTLPWWSFFVYLLKFLLIFPSCCSDFRYESNGIFVLGVGFFFNWGFFFYSGWVFFFGDFLTSHFWRNFFYHSKGIVVLSLNLKRYFTCDHFS